MRDFFRYLYRLTLCQLNVYSILNLFYLAVLRKQRGRPDGYSPAVLMRVQNTSSDDSSSLMKPKPLASLKNLTIPFFILINNNNN